MRLPLSWLRELADVPASVDAHDVATRLIEIGFEIESVETVGAVSGPLVIGEVVDFVDEPQKNGKTIRWCQVRVAPDAPLRGIVCGALNFAVGDRVVVALPGTVLPGGFEIGARKTYGHVSDGMICSVRELGIGDEHTGILVVDPSLPVGADAAAALGLGEAVIDVGVTPDRGYGMSARGIARDLAAAYGVAFRDPAAIDLPAPTGPAWPVRIDDPVGCDRFVARSVTGLDATAQAPAWMVRRLEIAGMRSVSLAVDVTNYVMLELGQPLHAYDRAALRGPIVVRRAAPGEQVRTLDGSSRDLHVDDLVIADDSGAIGVAGVMGGASTEIGSATSDIVIEAAHFTPSVVSRAARRHQLLSEASRRFERGVDPALAAVAAQRTVSLLAEHGKAKVDDTATDVGTPLTPPMLRIPADLPARVVGVPYTRDEVIGALTAIGCAVSVEGGAPEPVLAVQVPSWRNDLRDPYDLVEEVARLVGYDRIPSVLPAPPASGGLSEFQRARRRAETALAAAGFVEAQTYPFVGAAELDALMLAVDDPRRRGVRLANPLSDDQPFLRTTLLPGLLAALRRNLSRGLLDVALFESGVVFRMDDGPLPRPPVLPVDRPPDAAQVAALDAALPRQPRRLALVAAGQWERSGWWGPGRPVSWADAVESVRLVARAGGAELDVAADAEHAPWHPGRCAVLRRDGAVVGHAGELHPRVVEALGLPAPTIAAELDLDMVLTETAPTQAPVLSTYPLAASDVALVVPAAVPASAVEAALRSGAGPLLESLRLFDVYTGTGVEEGHRSLAFRLNLRAPDRTLTVEEVNAVRDAAVATAAARTGAVLRG